MEAGQGRWQLGPGKLHVWSVRPVRDLTVSSLYRDLLEYVHSDIPRIREAFRLRHLEDVKTDGNIVQISPLVEKKEDEYPLHAFPGSIPYSLMRADISILYDGRRRYVYLYKGDGQRLRLYFARIRGQPIVFFMTRPGFFCLLPSISNLPAQLFEGTKLDVELIYNPQTETRRLEVFDAISIGGRLVGHYNFMKRLHLAHYLLQFLLLTAKLSTTESKTVVDSYSPLNNYEVPYSPRFPSLLQTTTTNDDAEFEMMQDLGITNAFRPQQPTTREKKTEEEQQEKEKETIFGLARYGLVAKGAYSIWEMHHLLYEVIPAMPEYAQEGLIAMPDEDPVLPGPCPHIKKIKIGRRLNTLDLLCGQMKDEQLVSWWAELPARHRQEDAGKRLVKDWRDTRIVLFDAINGGGGKGGVELVREDGTAGRWYKWTDLYGKIIECRMDSAGNWQPVRLRDKRKPNTLETCLRTVENMDLTYREIFRFLDPSKPGPVLEPHQRAMQLQEGYAQRIWLNQKI